MPDFSSYKINILSASFGADTSLANNLNLDEADYKPGIFEDGDSSQSNDSGSGIVNFIKNIDGFIEKYKENKAEKIQDSIAEKEILIANLESEKNNVDVGYDDDLILSQEQVDIVYDEYQDALKSVDKTLAKKVDKVKNLMDEKRLNFDLDNSELISKMSKLESEILEKYPEMQVYIDNYNSAQNRYLEAKSDMSNDLESDIQKNQKKLDKLDSKLNKYIQYIKDATSEKNETIGSKKKTVESTLKLSDVSVNDKAEVTSSYKEAETKFKNALNELNNVINDETSELKTLNDKKQKIYESLYDVLKTENHTMASELYLLNYKIEVKNNQIAELNKEIAQCDEFIENIPSQIQVATNTLSVYKEMLSNLNKFDETKMSTEKKEELNTKKAKLQDLIDKQAKSLEISASLDEQDAIKEKVKIVEKRDALISEVNDLKSDMTALQNDIKEKYPDLSDKVEKFNTINEKYDSTKAKALKTAKSDYVKSIKDRNSKELKMKDIMAVEKAQEYAFINTELPADFANKLDAKLGSGFCSRLSEICDKYGLNEQDLIGLMYSESRLDPKATNSYGGATGLIQFMPDTAKNVLNTTTAYIKSLNAVQQLDYVDKYLSTCLKVGGNYDAGELYTAVYMPARVGKEVVASPSIGGYYGNTGLDTNKDGQTTKTELSQKVKKKYAEALKAFGC